MARARDFEESDHMMDMHFKTSVVPTRVAVVWRIVGSQPEPLT